MKRWLGRMLLVALASVTLFVGASWIYAQRLTRARPSNIGNPPADFPYPISSVHFTTADDETLSGWLVPGPRSDRAIILLHGYGGNRLQMLPRARFLRAEGYTVLIYDARACGESSGDAITFGYRERQDAIAAFKFLKARGYEHIGCLGVSQGGATILFAGEELPDLKCVICESVYDEMIHAVDRRMRHYMGVPGSLGACLMVPFAEQRLGVAIDDVRPIEHIHKLRCPIFIISGEEDDKTLPDDTQRLFDAARQPKELWLIPEARHEDLCRFAEYEGKVRDFLKRYFD